MQRRTRLVIVSLVLLISACVSNKPSVEPLSKDKEAELYLKMGVRYLEMNMLKEAKDKLYDAVSADSSNEKVHNMLGVLHERLRQYDEATHAYQTAVDLDPSNASINNNYGRFLCERGDFEVGMKFLKKALLLPLNNRQWFAYTNIGRCELMHGDANLAEGNFRQALLVNKRYSPALLEMQKISYRAGKYMSARGFLERYLAVAKHSPKTLWYAVQTEKSLGNDTLVNQYKTQLYHLFPASKETQQLKGVEK